MSAPGKKTVRFLIVMSILAGACGGNPNSVTAPTSAPTASIQSQQQSLPADGGTTSSTSDQPNWSLAGPTGQCLTPRDLGRWVFDVRDAGNGFHLVKAAFTDERAGCDPTEHHPTTFSFAGLLDYPKHGAGQTVFTYDTSQVLCGRVQVDASIIDAEGKETLIIGQVITADHDCVSPPPPPPSPPPPPPSPPPCKHPHEHQCRGSKDCHSDACRKAHCHGK